MKLYLKVPKRSKFRSKIRKFEKKGTPNGTIVQHDPKATDDAHERAAHVWQNVSVHWILGRAPSEKCFGQTTTKRYWQSTTLCQPELTRDSHLGGLVYKYILVIQVSGDAICTYKKYVGGEI